MKIIAHKITGNVHVEENTQFNHIHADRVIIGKNVKARLYGSIKKSLVLRKGSTVYFHGTLQGTVENDGGEIHYFRV